MSSHILKLPERPRHKQPSEPGEKVKAEVTVPPARLAAWKIEAQAADMRLAYFMRLAIDRFATELREERLSGLIRPPIMFTEDVIETHTQAAAAAGMTYANWAELMLCDAAARRGMG